MQFPDDSIGISDMLAWRDCPARFEFGMRRHTGKEAPESWSPQTAYGSAIHDVIAAVEEGVEDDEAIRTAFRRFVNWLEPADVDRLRIDLATYQERDWTGVRTLVSEEDLRIPLFVYKGRQIYFRFRLDRLYQRLDDETALVHIDYKSSKWVKSAEEVDKDLQLWAYNVGIHEIFAECEDLLQVYDQLSHGQETTRKTDAQRESMKAWMIEVATAMLDDEELAPRFNPWCRWCPLKMDCRVVREELTDWAVATIDPLIVRSMQKKKDGSDSKKAAKPTVDRAAIMEYVEILPTVAEAAKILREFENAVGDVMKETPDSDLAEMTSPKAPNGYAKVTDAGTYWTASGLEEAHRRVGVEFYHLATVSKAAVERHFGKGEEAKLRINAILELMERGSGATKVLPRRPPATVE